MKVFLKKVLLIQIILISFALFLPKINATYAIDDEISHTGINTNIYGDDSHQGGQKGPFPIGFTFNYYGTDFTQVNININGTLQFETYYTSFSNTSLSSTSATNNAIYVFWDDLKTKDYTDKTIYYATIGDEGSRKFVVQWTGMYFYGTEIQMGTFQVILYEGTNDIQIQYRDLLGGDRALGNSATIGIKKDSSTYEELSYNTATLTEGQAIQYVPNGTNDYTVNTEAEYDLVYVAPPGAPASPTLVNPTDGLTGVTTTPSFEWLPAENATSYNVLISTVSDFSSTIVNQTGITGTSYDHTSDLNNSTQYYWRVESVNSVSSSLSPTRSFTTGAANNAPNTPSSVSSQNLISNKELYDTEGESITATLSDTDESEQVRYRIQIASEETFTNLTLDYRAAFGEEGSATFTFGENTGTYLVGNADTVFSVGKYYLRIRTEDDSAASSAWYTVSGIAFNIVDRPTYSLSYSAQENGTISGTTSQEITYGLNGTSVEATGNDNYRFLKWSDESTENPRSDQNVMQNISVSAIFEKIDTEGPTKTKFLINNGDSYTNNNAVTLDIQAVDNLNFVTQMLVSSTPNFTGAEWETYATTKSWTISEEDGIKNVYVKFKDTYENESLIYSTSITLDTFTEIVLSTEDTQEQTTNNGEEPEFISITEKRRETQKQKPKFSGTGEPGALVTITIHSDPIIGTTTVGNDGNWEWWPEVDIPHGEHEVTIVIEDNAGNTAQTDFELGVVLAATDSVTESVETKTTEELAKTGTRHVLVFMILGFLILLKYTHNTKGILEYCKL